MEEFHKIKLNLACGNDYRAGYINIDNGSMFAAKKDMLADIFDLTWKREDVDEILVSHFMMYVIPCEALTLFDRWHAWLKKGGKLIIETGDLKKIAKTILESNDPSIINGSNGTIQLFGASETSGHRYAWCKDTLVPLLRYAGFKNLMFEDGGLHNRPERDLTITATK